MVEKNVGKPRHEHFAKFDLGLAKVEKKALLD